LHFCTQPKFLDDDLMAHSHATYTVFESDCLMLSDLELSDSAALLRFDEEEDENDNEDTATIGLEEQDWTRRNFVPGKFWCLVTFFGHS